MQKSVTSSFALLLSAIILLFLSCTGLTQTQKNGQSNLRKETSAERFYRKGGKESKAEITEMNGELTSSNIAQDRNLTRYDNGGHFDCRRFVLPKDRVKSNCDLQKVIDFIWTHWQDKREGYIRITFDSVDAESTAHIFIEPNTKGIWHVAWRWARHTGIITDLPEIISIEQVKSDKTDALVFKDKDGDETQRISLKGGAT